MTDEIDDDAIKEAWDAIARTPAGAVAYGHMQRVAIGLLATPDPSDGALRAEFGRRSLAHDLMRLMRKGIDESGGRSGKSSGKRSERLLVFRVREPVSVSRRESARDHIIRTDPELKPRGG
jgi:hypothetical protein